MDCSPPGFSVHGIFQARILEWVTLPSSRGSSRPQDRNHISYISWTGRQILYLCTTCLGISCWEAAVLIFVFPMVLCINDNIKHRVPPATVLSLRHPLSCSGPGSGTPSWPPSVQDPGASSALGAQPSACLPRVQVGAESQDVPLQPLMGLWWGGQCRQVGRHRNSLDKYPEVEQLGHMVVLFLIFWGFSILSPTVAAPKYRLNNSMWGFSSLCILYFCCFLSFQ